MFATFAVLSVVFFLTGIVLLSSDPLNLTSKSWEWAGWSWVVSLVCLGGLLASLL